MQSKPAAAADQTWTLGFAFAPVLDDPASVGDAPLTFTGVAYSGGIVPGYGYLGNVAIDLSTASFPEAGIPVLIDHNATVDGIAGRGTLTRHTALSGEVSLRIAGTLTEATAAGRQIAALMREKFPLQMSVGMSAKLRETAGAETINGRTLAADHVFEHGFIREASFLPTGADPETSAAFAFSATAAPGSTPPKSAEKGHAMTTPETTAQLAAHTARIAELEAQLAASNAAAEAAATAARKVALGALFADLGRAAPTDEQAAPYLSMTEAAFSAVAADMRATKPAGNRQADPALFSSQSTRLTAGQPPQGAQGAGEALFGAVKALIRS